MDQAEDKNVVSQYTRQLSCKLAESEVRDYGAELARKVQEREEVEEDKKAANSAFKSRIDEISARIKILGQKIREGKELRFIKVEERLVDLTTADDRERKIRVFTIRLDSGDVISEREANQEERQGLLFEKVEKVEKVDQDDPEKIAKEWEDSYSGLDRPGVPKETEKKKRGRTARKGKK